MILSNLRTTLIEMAMRCQMQLFHYLTLGQKPPNFAMFRGTCMHKSMEHNFRTKFKTKTDIRRDEAIHIYDTAFNQEKDKIDFTGTNAGKEQETGRKMVVEYLEEQAFKWFPANKNENPIIEYPGYINVKKEGLEPLVVSMTVDLLTDKMVAIDHKTANRKWAVGKEKDKIQAQLYPIVLNNSGFKVNKFEFGVAYPGGTQSIPVNYDEQLAKMILNNAMQICENMRKETPIPNRSGWWCSDKYCGWYADCCFGGKNKTTLDFGSNSNHIQNEIDKNKNMILDSQKLTLSPKFKTKEEEENGKGKSGIGNNSTKFAGIGGKSDIFPIGF